MDCLMFKMSHAGENHSDTVFVRSIDRLLVSDRSSRLYDSCNTCLVSSFYTIGEREKGIRCHHTSRNTIASLTDSVFSGPNPADLSRADTRCTQIFSDSDTVRFGMFHYFPGEDQISHFSFGRLPFCDDLQFRFMK